MMRGLESSGNLYHLHQQVALLLRWHHHADRLRSRPHHHATHPSWFEWFWSDRGGGRSQEELGRKWGSHQQWRHFHVLSWEDLDRVMRNPKACPPLCPSPRECIILPLLLRLLSVHCTRSSSESKSPSRDCISLYAFPLVRDQTRFAYCLLMLTITVFMNITCPSTMIFWITFCMPLNSS